MKKFEELVKTFKKYINLKPFEICGSYLYREEEGGLNAWGIYEGWTKEWMPFGVVHKNWYDKKERRGELTVRDATDKFFTLNSKNYCLETILREEKKLWTLKEIIKTVLREYPLLEVKRESERIFENYSLAEKLELPKSWENEVKPKKLRKGELILLNLEVEERSEERGEGHHDIDVYRSYLGVFKEIKYDDKTKIRMLRIFDVEEGETDILEMKVKRICLLRNLIFSGVKYFLGEMETMEGREKEKLKEEAKIQIKTAKEALNG